MQENSFTTTGKLNAVITRVIGTRQSNTKELEAEKRSAFSR